MEAKTATGNDRKPSDERNGQRGALAPDDVGRLEQAIMSLGEQQIEIVKALGALSARMPAPTVQDPLVEIARQVQLHPEDPKPYTNLGNRLMLMKQYEKAEAAFRVAIKLSVRVPVAHSNLGMALQKQGKLEEAEQAYRDALAIEPLCPARKHLGDILIEAKKFDEALAFWKAEMEASPADAIPARNATAVLLYADRLPEAAEYARMTAAQRWATRFWPERLDADPPFSRSTPAVVKTSKLRHDIEQLEYLMTRGILVDEAPGVIAGLRKVLDRVAPFGDFAINTLTQEERRDIAAQYNRIQHITEAPRVAKALSYKWDMAKIEEEYVSKPPGIIYFDDLLSPEAMAGLRRFCVESTIWLSTNHDNGYLGAYFADGFCTPLLVQIAEELRAAMPRVIGDRRIVGMWGYKYDQTMTGINTHADMAAVNVNFWITPDDANLDPTSGGLVVHDAEAPQEWDFETFNGNAPGAAEKIQEFIKTSGSKEVVVPYKQNRAVIFNSDLFHQTAPLHFKPGYENRRVNVTLLYGDRSDGRMEVGRTE